MLLPSIISYHMVSLTTTICDMGTEKTRLMKVIYLLTYLVRTKCGLVHLFEETVIILVSGFSS